MNQEIFIDTIKLVVTEGSTKAVESLLLSPPGRSPNTEIVEMSNWFNRLSSEDKLMTMKIVKESVEMSVFSFLCVIDGVTAIEDFAPKGKLVLSFEKNGETIVLNGPDDNYLHDLL